MRSMPAGAFPGISCPSAHLDTSANGGLLDERLFIYMQGVVPKRVVHLGGCACCGLMEERLFLKNTSRWPSARRCFDFAQQPAGVSRPALFRILPKLIIHRPPL